MCLVNVLKLQHCIFDFTWHVYLPPPPQLGLMHLFLMSVPRDFCHFLYGHWWLGWGRHFWPSCLTGIWMLPFLRYSISFTNKVTYCLTNLYCTVEGWDWRIWFVYGSSFLPDFLCFPHTPDTVEPNEVRMTVVFLLVWNYLSVLSQLLSFVFSYLISAQYFIYH